MSFLFGFWIGLFCGIGGSWIYAHPDKREEIVTKIKAMFGK